MWIQNKKILKLFLISIINNIIKTWNLLCKKTKKLEKYNDCFVNETR